MVTLISSFTRNKKPLVEHWRGAVRPGRRWGNPRAPAGRGPISGWKPGPPSPAGPCKQQAPGDGVQPGVPWKTGQHAAGVWGAVTPVSWGLLLRSAVSPETRSTVQRPQFPLCGDRTALIRVDTSEPSQRWVDGFCILGEAGPHSQNAVPAEAQTQAPGWGAGGWGRGVWEPGGWGRRGWGPGAGGWPPLPGRQTPLESPSPSSPKD